METKHEELHKRIDELTRLEEQAKAQLYGIQGRKAELREFLAKLEEGKNKDDEKD